MNSYHKFLLFLLPWLLVTACRKQLDVLPTTSQVDGNVITDAKSAATVLNGVYNQFANSGTDYNNVPSIKWVDINEFLPSVLVGTIEDYAGSDLQTYTFTAQSYNAGDIWNYCYRVVNAANGFLKNVAPVNDIPAATKKQMIAEAKFLRAFGNSELLLYYAQYDKPDSKYGILLRDEFVNAGNINLPRSTVADAYTSILGDLDTAIAGLPTVNTKPWYANVSAARLLKARVLINRGSAGDYDQVISLTKEIIADGPFSLEPNTEDIFLTKAFDSKEVILGLEPFPNETYKYFQYIYYLFYGPTDNLVSLLDNDPRSAWVYASPSNYPSVFTKYYPDDPVTGSAEPIAEYSYAFRLTEAWLLEAEAITLNNGDLAQAKALLKEVEGHSGITDFSEVDNTTTAADLQVLIVKETMKNFVGENGADWFALRRLPLATIQTIRPEIPSRDALLLPIPSDEILFNNKMIQNPGY